jgi:drug/metabolite transporter (DMT)-like permease
MTPTPRTNSYEPYLLLAALLCADAASFLCEKLACNRAGGDGWTFLGSVVGQPWLWAAWALAPIQLWMWTRILGRLDLSFAYPISGLSTLLTLPAATLLLGERLSWQVWTGALLITLGGAIIGPGGKAHHPTQTPPG